VSDGIDIRPISEDEVDDFLRRVEAGFLTVSSDEELEREKLAFERDHALAALDGVTIVGTTSAYSLEVTLPGGAPVAMAGVTAVGVAPTHRRRGILRSLMETQINGLVDRGLPLAGLLSSEAPIYGRFGYGVAEEHRYTTIDAPRFALGVKMAELADEIRIEAVPITRTDDELIDVVGPFWERHRLTQVGELGRSDDAWRAKLSTLPKDRFEYLAGRGDDVVGVAMVNAKVDWIGAVPDGSLRATVAADDDVARAALVAFVSRVDLVRSVSLATPVDDPLRWAVVDRRAIRTDRVDDHLWLRVLDLPAAIEARRWATNGSVILGVDDPLLSANSGTWKLVVEDGWAQLDRSQAEPEITMSISAVAPLLTGAASPHTLTASAAIRGAPDALERLAGMARVDRAPFCQTGF